MSNIVQANHGFTVSDENGKTTFTYNQEQYTTKILFMAIFACAIFSVLLLGIVKPSSAGSAFGFWLVFTIGLYRLVLYLANRKRTPQSFYVDKQGFHVNGKTYLKQDVTSMYIQSLKSAETHTVSMQSGMFIPVSGKASSMLAASSMNAINAVGQIGDRMAMASRNKVVAINYRVYIRYGNKPVILAKGMTADTAEVMLNKIVEVSESYRNKS